MPALLPGAVKLVEKEKEPREKRLLIALVWVGCMRPPERLQIGKSSRKEVHKNGKPVI